MMRFLIMLESTESGFSVQVPDLAIVTHGKNIEAAKQAAVEAIRVNLDAYQEVGREVPECQPLLVHLENPEFKDLLFTFVELTESKERIAA